MRPIERRLVALEARTVQPSSASYRVFVIPRGEDEATFRARCEAEAGASRCQFIRFVAPGEVRGMAALH